jgi:hypothetical protein
MHSKPVGSCEYAWCHNTVLLPFFYGIDRLFCKSSFFDEKSPPSHSLFVRIAKTLYFCVPIVDARLVNTTTILYTIAFYRATQKHKFIRCFLLKTLDTLTVGTSFSTLLHQINAPARKTVLIKLKRKEKRQKKSWNPRVSVSVPLLVWVDFVKSWNPRVSVSIPLWVDFVLNWFTLSATPPTAIILWPYILEHPGSEKNRKSSKFTSPSACTIHFQTASPKIEMSWIDSA